MNDRNKRVSINRRVAELIEDRSDDEMDVAAALSEAIEERGSDVTTWLSDGEAEAERTWMQWYGEHRNSFGDQLAHAIALSHYTDLEETA